MSEPAMRRAGPDDLDALRTLHAQLNPDDPPPARDRLAAIPRRIVASEEFDLLVATLDDVVVATCYLNIIPDPTRGGASHAAIENVVVDASLRGGGLGQRVVRCALAEAWRRGCYKVLLQTGSRVCARAPLLRSLRLLGNRQDRLRRASRARVTPSRAPTLILP